MDRLALSDAHGDRMAPHNNRIHAQRHRIEGCFSKLKQLRRVATRYEKTARNDRAIPTLAATILWLR